jgi:hypothetical protein
MTKFIVEAPVCARVLLITGLMLVTGAAVAQQGIPNQPAAGQQPQGTAAATAGRSTSDAGSSRVTPATADNTGNTNSAGLPTTATDQPKSTPVQPRYDQGGYPVAQPDAPKPGALPTKNVDDPTDTSGLLPTANLPSTEVTLVGGFVDKIDPVNDRMTVKPFGSKEKMHVFFDDRSRVVRNGREVSPMAIKKGDRIYLDTQVDKKHGRIFARNVRVQTKRLEADAHGQIVGLRNGTVQVHDDLSGENVSFKILQGTTVVNQGRPGTLADLQPGAIVSAQFLPTGDGNNEVNHVDIVAAPGTAYTFLGKLTHLDLRNRLIGIENQSDGKIYDVAFDPRQTQIADLHIGEQVNVTAKFDGRTYMADAVTPATGTSIEEIEKAADEQEKEDQADAAGKSDASPKQGDTKTDQQGGNANPK